MTRSLGSGGGGVGGTGFFAGRFAVVVLAAGFAGGLETGRFAVVFAVGFLAAGFRFCVPVGLAAVGFLQGIFRAKQPLHDCRMTVLAEFLRHGVFRLFPQPDGVSGCGMIPDSLLCILSVDDEKNQTFWER